MSQVVYIRVRLEIQEGADVHEVIEDMDYNFEHAEILSSEVVELY